MDKNDLKEIKSIIDSALETHLGSVHEEITDMRNEMATRTELVNVEARLEAKIDTLAVKIDRVDGKLGAFENSEIDKRLQLDVRTGSIEKHLNLSERRA